MLPLRITRRISHVGALVTTAVLAVSVLVATQGAFASPSPPPNPTNAQLTGAQQTKNDLATEVGQLAAQTAQLQSRLDQLTAQRELAEQKLAYALSKLAIAKAAATTARQTVQLAEQKVVAAQQDFVGYVQATYMAGDVSGTTGTLLTASDPNVLLTQGSLQRYASGHELNAIGDMQRATVGKSNADAAARRAVQVQAAAAQDAATTEQQAVAAVDAANAQQQQLQSALAANQAKLQDAQVQLATLNGERATFLAYQQEQARLAAIRRQQQLAAEAAARAQAARSGGGPSGPYVPPASGGSWSAGAGQQAAARAMRWLGTPYSWAGGNASGPTYGVCAGDGAFNDCNVVGFDCSGLAMYAWAQVPFAHYAATQYEQGSYHPDVANLLPGDLVFWSSDGTVAGIHHVAIYIGNGNVVQAPESGALIQVTPVYSVSPGLFGATRPLT